ncbi:MAG TPA: SDR family oxidoreductase, partial [Armatimonadota bacterium]|nr:SDR family oxidoreductase [Armatimonadota bacterium]
TGGGKGIGKGISLRLAAEGMSVFLCGRTEEALAETAAMVGEAGGKATPIVADVSEEAQVNALVDRVHEETGRLDLLVHNAAMVRGGSLSRTDAEYWRAVYAANADSTFYLAKACGEIMIEQNSGNMVLISTIGATRSHHRMLAYDSSKCAVEGVMKSLALELAPNGIRVNAVAPGATMRDAIENEVPLDKMGQPHVPMGRRGTPAETAAAVAFLASRQSSYITGQVLRVDGGATTQLSPPGIFI